MNDRDIKFTDHPATRDPNAEVKLKIGPRRSKFGERLAIAYTEVGDDVIVLDLEVVANETEARDWFARVAQEKPWIERH